MVYYLIGAFAGLVLIYIIFVFNKLISFKNKVNEAFSTLDVYLKKRWDLIPNVVETVKGYSEYEKDTFMSVVSLRNSSYEDLSLDAKIDADSKVNKAVSRFMMLAESYPELKASESFLDLSKQLSMVEEDIANARKYYNAVVKHLNNLIEMFPSNIIAKIFGYKTSKMFEAGESERSNVKVNLS